MSRTYRNRSERKWLGSSRHQEFRCRHCRLFVPAPPSGGQHRNHCPYCLYSRHVDGARPGDRASTCGGSMAAVGAFTRPKGEHVIVHRCHDCGHERYNRIAADDDFFLVQRLPLVEPRGSNKETAAYELERTA